MQVAKLRTRLVPNTSLAQEFYRLGGVVLEIVGPQASTESQGECTFWGLALRVDDIDVTKVGEVR